MSNLHEVIKVIRTEKGLKQEEVASKLSMAQSNYARLEKGLTQVTVDRLQQLADVFDVPIATILSYEIGQSQPTREDIDYYINLCHKYEKQITALKKRVEELEQESIEEYSDKYEASKEFKEKIKQANERLKLKEKEWNEKLAQKEALLESKNQTISILELAVKALTKE